jgi:hypothetical protein
LLCPADSDGSPLIFFDGALEKRYFSPSHFLNGEIVAHKGHYVLLFRLILKIENLTGFVTKKFESSRVLDGHRRQ